MSADTPPVQLDRDDPHVEAFGRLQELVRQFLAGEIDREYMAERHAAITVAVAATRGDFTTADTCMGCDTNGGHYDWCQGADPELEDAVTELPGESRKGDTAGPRVWTDPGSVEPTDCSVTGRRGIRWDRSSEDGGWHRAGVSVHADTEWHFWPAWWTAKAR